MDKTAEQLIVDLIRGEMELADSQVWVRSQNKTIPASSGLFVIVGMVDSRPLASKSYIKEQVFESLLTTESGGVLLTEDGLSLATEDETYTTVYEVQQAQTVDTIQISILSRDNSALLRRWEVMTALKSVAAQQMQEENGFKISRLPSSFLNVSGAEGGSNINRFTLNFNCFVPFEKIKELSGGYYDDFKTRVDDSNTIGTDTPLIEFRFAADTAINALLLDEESGQLLQENGIPIGLDAELYNGP